MTGLWHDPIAIHFYLSLSWLYSLVLGTVLISQPGLVQSIGKTYKLFILSSLNEWGDFKLRQASDSQILYDRSQIENCFLKNWFVTIISKLLTLASKYCRSDWINFLGYLISKMWKFTSTQWLNAEGSMKFNLDSCQAFCSLILDRNSGSSSRLHNKDEYQPSESSLSLYQ